MRLSYAEIVGLEQVVATEHSVHGEHSNVALSPTTNRVLNDVADGQATAPLVAIQAVNPGGVLPLQTGPAPASGTSQYRAAVLDT